MSALLIGAAVASGVLNHQQQQNQHQNQLALNRKTRAAALRAYLFGLKMNEEKFAQGKIAYTQQQEDTLLDALSRGSQIKNQITGAGITGISVTQLIRDNDRQYNKAIGRLDQEYTNFYDHIKSNREQLKITYQNQLAGIHDPNAPNLLYSLLSAGTQVGTSYALSTL